MKKYDYLQAVCDDVRDYIERHEIIVNDDNRDDIEQELNDTLFIEDSVTGNASGSYTFNAWRAEENICHNLDLLKEACEEFGTPIESIIESANCCDVTIRCYLLPRAINTVLNEMV